MRLLSHIAPLIWILFTTHCSEKPTGEDLHFRDASDENRNSQPEASIENDAETGIYDQTKLDAKNGSDTSVENGSEWADRPERETPKQIETDASASYRDSASDAPIQAEIDANATSGPRLDSGIKTASDAGTQTSGEGFNNRQPVVPQISEQGGSGNVTTYGNVINPEPSRGGACNYGETEILNFAAIHVNLNSGDGLGQWNGGRICGQCAEVRVETANGPKMTTVRIVDKCPDAFCGIDLGGAPARATMGTSPGRYDGTWQFIPCPADPAVSDGPPALFVKEGSNPWWAIIQVRNPPAAVVSISWQSSSGSGTFTYATEAENFYTVPESVRNTAETVTLTITYDFGIQHTIGIVGQLLTVESAVYKI